MEYLVKIDFDKLNPKQLSSFMSLFESQKVKKFIIRQSNQSILIKTPLFDYLEYEFLANKVYVKQLAFSLYEKDIESGKFKPIIQGSKIMSDDYNLMLRKIRLS